jgi:hypothetical protein
MIWNLSHPPPPPHQETFCSECDIILPLQHTNIAIPVHLSTLYQFTTLIWIVIYILQYSSVCLSYLQIYRYLTWNITYVCSTKMYSLYTPLLIISYFYSCYSCVLVCTSETKSADISCCTPPLFFRADPEADKSTSCTWEEHKIQCTEVTVGVRSYLKCNLSLFGWSKVDIHIVNLWALFKV